MPGETEDLDALAKAKAAFYMMNDPALGANLKLRERIALAQMTRRNAYPKTFGEGLASIGDSTQRCVDGSTRWTRRMRQRRSRRRDIPGRAAATATGRGAATGARCGPARDRYGRRRHRYRCTDGAPGQYEGTRYSQRLPMGLCNRNRPLPPAGSRDRRQRRHRCRPTSRRSPAMSSTAGSTPPGPGQQSALTRRAGHG